MEGSKVVNKCVMEFGLDKTYKANSTKLYKKVVFKDHFFKSQCSRPDDNKKA